MVLQRMLLHADDGKIIFFPAWPRDWDVDFKLHAPRQTVVQGHVRNGKLVEMKVTPENRAGDVVVMEPFASGARTFGKPEQAIADIPQETGE